LSTVAFGRQLADAPAKGAGQQLAGRGDIAQRIETRAGMAGGVDQGGQERRHDDDPGDAPLGQQVEKRQRIARRDVVGDDTGNALQQAAEHLPDRVDEVQRGLVAAQLVGSEREGFPHPFETAEHGPMGPEDTLGRSRGAGGVEHIGQRVGMPFGGAPVRPSLDGGRRGGQNLVEAKRPGRRVGEEGELLEQRARRQDQRRRRVPQHELQPAFRIRRIERNPGATCLEDTQCAGRRLDSAPKR
jgi:hypothetical protein